MKTFPVSFGYLILHEVIDSDRATYKCTFDDCGKLVSRRYTSARQAAEKGYVSACKTCARKLRRRKPAAVAPGSAWKGVGRV